MSTPRPWALGRIEEPAHRVVLPYVRVELDSDTQTGRYLDQAGRPIELGQHGTQQPTSQGTATSYDGRQDRDNNPDYAQD